jgi:hypothetical protein
MIRNQVSTSRGEIFEREEEQNSQLNVKVKGREMARVNTGRRRLENTHRRQVGSGFCGVQAHRIHCLWHRQKAHHTHAYLLSLRPSGKLAVVLYQGIALRSEPQTQAPGLDAS